MIHQFRSESGMSLVQVLVAVAITVLTGTFVMQMVLQMKKVEVLMSLQSEASDIERQAQRILADPISCFNTIEPAALGKKVADFPASGIPLTSVNGPNTAGAPTPEKIIEVATPPFPKDKQMVLSALRLTLKKPGDPNPVPPFDINAVETVFLELEFKKTINEIGGEFIMRRIPISIHTNNNGEISRCSGLNQLDLAEDICTGMDLPWDPVGMKCDLRDADIIAETACKTLSLGYDASSKKCN